MKITRNKLRDLILEEITRARLNESEPMMVTDFTAIGDQRMGPYPAGTIFTIYFGFSDHVTSVYAGDEGVVEFNTIMELISWISSQGSEAVYKIPTYHRDMKVNPVDAIDTLEVMRSAFKKLSR